MRREYTPSEPEVDAAEEVLCEALSQPLDRFWRPLAEDILIAAWKAARADSEPVGAVGVAMGILSEPINPNRR